MSWTCVGIALLAGCLSACREERAPDARERHATASAAESRGGPLDEQCIRTIKEANIAAADLATAIDGKGALDGVALRRSYVVMRRRIAAAAPYFRLHAELGTEVLLGPPRSLDETGGFLGLLDGALTSGARAEARRAMAQVVRALRLIDNELRLTPIAAREALQSMSDASYELGLVLLEAYPAVPDGSDAVLADARGMLEGIEAGALAILAIAPDKAEERAKGAVTELRDDAKPLRAALDKVAHAHELADRATLVQHSGAIGLGVRRLAQVLGIAVKLPYRAREPQAKNAADQELVTPFTLPAPRRDARDGDAAALAALGRALFFERRLSQGARRACADCHRPDQAYSDGLAVAPSLVADEPLLRNTPTLLYAPLHAAQLWDGRFASAERQAIKVIHTASEMGLKSGELVGAVSSVPELEARFREVFADGVTEANVARALAAFQVEALVPGTAPIDRFARGDDAALSSDMRRGLDVFVGVGRCGRCHVPPLFGGSRPLDFAVPVFATLGVPERPGARRLDSDAGRAAVTHNVIDQGAFKTPTARNIERTAPYFHHGRFRTLEEVVDFYDLGGGRGAGIDVDNQDPDVRPLKLGDERKRALLSFMREALSDKAIPR
jgi:cytochrome c peroxidase